MGGTARAGKRAVEPGRGGLDDGDFRAPGRRAPGWADARLAGGQGAEVERQAEVRADGGWQAQSVAGYKLERPESGAGACGVCEQPAGARAPDTSATGRADQLGGTCDAACSGCSAGADCWAWRGP